MEPRVVAGRSALYAYGSYALPGCGMTPKPTTAVLPTEVGATLLVFVFARAWAAGPSNTSRLPAWKRSSMATSFGGSIACPLAVAVSGNPKT
jgi:hypothetical protein